MNGTVIVTGAAGSIGSEVCRRLAGGPYRVIALDIAETPLFWLHKELPEVIPVIGSVTDFETFNRLVSNFMPLAVIHAAALKHVDMCERNMLAAIETNVFGTYRVATVAARYGARMIFVSTDKAVNPTTVMGATKRLAELMVSGYQNVRIVRLVNIWGSAGSIVPVVQQQIEAGGPVTITHMDAQRFFMSIGQAASMVVSQIETSTDAPYLLIPSNVLFEKRYIRDVILQLIGKRVGIELHVTGLKAGEKLVEEIATAAELRLCIDGLVPLKQWTGSIMRLAHVTRMAEPEAARVELFNLVRYENA